MIECAQNWPKLISKSGGPEILEAARKNKFKLVQQLLVQEQIKYIEQDRIYWMPLRKELEALRLARRKKKSME